jgi:type IX secretion system PorP/SprF family membrane protein
MKKIITKIAIVVASLSGVVYAQQDPQFTQWMHNKLIYNPGYAGTTGAICGVAQFRQQWVSFEGAPQSIAVAFDMSLQQSAGLPIGVGLNIIRDVIGPMKTTFARIPVSWNIPLGEPGGKLGIGLDFGIVQKSISENWIAPEPGKIDPSIPGAYAVGNNPELNKLTYDVGFGAFYQVPGKYYAGISSTHLPAQTLKDGSVQYEMSRHFYVMGGYTFPIDPRNKITPNILYKSDIAAGVIDANLTYMWSDMIWAGATYRLNNDAAAILLGYQGRAQGTISYKIGLSYDLNLSKINGYSNGTPEIILGLCYAPKSQKPSTGGNDRFLD